VGSQTSISNQENAPIDLIYVLPRMALPNHPPPEDAADGSLGPHGH